MHRDRLRTAPARPRRYGMFTVLLGVLSLVLTPQSGAAQTARAHQVLVLQSVDRGNIVFDFFTAEFRAAIQKRAASPVTLFDFVIAPPGFGKATDQSIVDFVQSNYADQPPDLIVTAGGPAAAFVRKNRQQLFPQSPIVFSALDERWFLRNAPLGEDESAVAVSVDKTMTIDDILELRPETQTVFVIMGSGPLAAFWQPELQHEFERYRNRLTFIWSMDLSYEQMLKRAATLPPHSAIFYDSADTFAGGTWQGDEKTFADLTAHANAPIFGVHRLWVGAGTVGGRVLDFEGLGDATADVVLRILGGERPGNIRIPTRFPGPPEFDARQLRRWNISETRLPPGSTVRFRAPSLWQDYRGEVLGVSIALVAQALLIAGLLYQRHARRRAEVESRRNLSLAADANRRVTMSALSGSIAHDLSQPLNAILHNAQAAELMLASNRVTPGILQAILADIRKADIRATDIIERHRTMLKNHELDAKPIDLHTVILESMTLVASDTTKRQIQVDVHLPTDSCVVFGDRILLQQVVVNLMMNAMDAMTDTPAERRRISVSNVVSGSSAKLSVRDEGTGLPAALDGTLSRPYATTKVNGLGIGLTIVRTIVEAHAGRIDAHNNPTGGATFIVTLPCHDAAAANLGAKERTRVGP